MNDKSDEAYNALFRSYEDANKRIKELEETCACLRLTISKLESLLTQAGLNVAELQAERRRLEIRIVGIKAELNEAQAEITRLREGGCAREQGNSQWCAEAQRLAERCRFLEKHIWHDAYEAAKESGEFDDDAEVIANNAIELLKQEAAHSGEGEK